MSSLLIEELSRDRMRTLLRESERARLARAVAGSRRAGSVSTVGRGPLRRAAGRWLISAGARLAGPEAARAIR